MPMLPTPRNPFPVKVPYYVRSDMYKLGKNIQGYIEDQLFIVDAHYEKIFWACLEVLKNYPQHSRVYLDADLDGLTACLWDVAACIAQELPEYTSFEGASFTSKLLGVSLEQDGTLHFERESALFPELGMACYEHLQGLSDFERLCDLLRLSVQEDLVISQVIDDGGSDRMECLLVPIPVKWDPLEKIGLTFAGVHAPIPNNDRLMGAAPNLVQAIMTKGPFVRYNWSISTSRLCRNPAIEENYRAADAILGQLDSYDEMMQGVHFRSERQTLVAFPQHNRYLFTIHTYLHPFAEVLTTRERQQTMLDVLQTVPTDVREHRGIVNGVIDHLATALHE